LETDAHLDWLSVTFDADMDERILEAYVGHFTTKGSGSHGYTRRAASPIGAILLTDGEKRQGKSLTLSGQPLSDLRAVLGADEPFLRAVIYHKGRASRVDLALNVHHSKLTTSLLWSLVKQGLLVTKTRTFKGVERADSKMEGFYIGARESDKFLRVYDKGLEQGSDPEAWLRLELVCKRLVARSYVEGMGQMDTIRPFINRAIDEFASFPTEPDYRLAVADDNADVPRMGKKQSQFWRWIETQVIPAMASRQVEYPEEDVLRTVSGLYIKHLDKRGRSLRPNDPLLDSSE